MAKRTLLTEIYNSVPTIPYEGDDELVHTDASPWCQDPSCPCHEGQRNWEYVEGRGYILQERNATLQCADGSWW